MTRGPIFCKLGWASKMGKIKEVQHLLAGRGKKQLFLFRCPQSPDRSVHGVGSHSSHRAAVDVWKFSSQVTDWQFKSGHLCEIRQQIGTCPAPERAAQCRLASNVGHGCLAIRMAAVNISLVWRGQ